MSGRRRKETGATIVVLGTPFQSVREATDRLYEVFACYTAPSRLDASPLADPARMKTRISGAPLNELSATDLGEFAFRAMTSVGDDRDYRHFLPRILELALRPSGVVGLEPELIGGKLEYCRWRAWPAAEIEAVERYFSACWTFSLTLPPDETHGSNWLVGLARGRMNIETPLEVWANASSQWAWLQLADFVLMLPGRFRQTGLVCGHLWDEIDPATVRMVSRWLKSQPLAQRLLEAGVNDVWPDDAIPEKLAAAADILDRLRHESL